MRFRWDVVPESAAQIVEYHNFVAELKQMVSDVRPHKASTTGN
jgi:hypothetical protein